ncbi:uncharacterized protein CLUP02_12305 [Colletotrichum lupini]|uniref:Secreted protein n=1 Tax=Colletotrichum lupini TaxID=145971 RepID=A0A9Q8T084_9PEZI|nr:uncharacterized protein CLUP02_12305 [Colletotrichum lupini]KAK1710160.1 hypothetical protein BDP67DRAFT_521931 [Colletotrichum lupini]UQC86803.1 hypothetical protein CLUP02_12305 [Colletotrichum lupini]
MPNIPFTAQCCCLAAFTSNTLARPCFLSTAGPGWFCITRILNHRPRHKTLYSCLCLPCRYPSAPVSPCSAILTIRRPSRSSTGDPSLPLALLPSQSPSHPLTPGQLVVLAN